MVICLEQGADLHMAQLMPLPLTVSCFSQIQIGFAFLVPAHPSSSGQRAVKRHYLPTVILIVILIIIGIPSPTHSFTLGLNHFFSANHPYRSLSFFSFRIHYMDSPDCLLLFLSISDSYF